MRRREGWEPYAVQELAARGGGARLVGSRRAAAAELRSVGRVAWRVRSEEGERHEQWWRRRSAEISLARGRRRRRRASGASGVGEASSGSRNAAKREHGRMELADSWRAGGGAGAGMAELAGSRRPGGGHACAQGGSDH